MKLSRLLEGAELSHADFSADPDISRIVYDSRIIEAGDLFCCIPGLAHDGHDFVSEAISAGASAVVSEKALTIGVPLIRTESSRQALASLSSFNAGNPSKDLKVVGVTGTNGKTSVVHLLEQILSNSGHSVKSSGTLTGERTTPEAPELQNQFSLWRDAEIKNVVMEVSSHALEQFRVDGTEFAAVAFTNLSRDHLDYHESMERYFKAKERLFQLQFSSNAVVVVGNEFGDKIAATAQKNGLEVLGVNPKEILDQGLWHGEEVRIPFKAGFMALNTLVAAELALLLGVDATEIAKQIEKLESVPGRFETIKKNVGPTVIIDYAHTPEALEATLKSTRNLKEKGKLIVVFGCGGGRDKGKRPLMGAVAENGADFTVVTSDNPREEPAGSIIKDILGGMKSSDFIVEEDRKKAIEIALRHASEDDVVLIAGKGHETTQEIEGEFLDFKDLEVVEGLIPELFGEGM
ncbi:MAG: UDP-N-acetylmuramoyl-L-alanyl-D-glutamate--2,6-diaminopimelate ligase [Acidimicrobiales bacterium AG-410-I20]|nr:MAG: UDP-N-acetylmuramoyl-L-alanyl-D-glutamate--2,6-diaminopimelate ligase [Acidimicrobiales bacterium AG-410-I20]